MNGSSIEIPKSPKKDGSNDIKELGDKLEMSRGLLHNARLCNKNHITVKSGLAACKKELLNQSYSQHVDRLRSR